MVISSLRHSSGQSVAWGASIFAQRDGQLDATEAVGQDGDAGRMSWSQRWCRWQLEEQFLTSSTRSSKALRWIWTCCTAFEKEDTTYWQVGPCRDTGSFQISQSLSFNVWNIFAFTLGITWHNHQVLRNIQQLVPCWNFYFVPWKS